MAMTPTMTMNRRYREASHLLEVELIASTQMSFKRIMSLVAMAFLWTGSQIPVYVFGWSLNGPGRAGLLNVSQVASRLISTVTLEGLIGGFGLYAIRISNGMDHD